MLFHLLSLAAARLDLIEAVQVLRQNFPFGILALGLLGAGGLYALQRAQADDRDRFDCYAVLLLLCLLGHGYLHWLDLGLSHHHLPVDYLLGRILWIAFGLGYSLSAARTTGPALRPFGRLGLGLFAPLLLLEVLYLVNADGWMYIDRTSLRGLYQLVSILLLLAWGAGCYRAYRRLRAAAPNPPEATP